MKKFFVPVLAVLMVLSLAACGMIRSVLIAMPGSNAVIANHKVSANCFSSESLIESDEKDALVGIWELAVNKIEGNIYAAFGSSVREQGAVMELTSDGKVSFYIGLTGGEGTYQIVDETDMIFTVTDFNEGHQWLYKGKIAIEDGTTYIKMDINGFNAVWKMQ